MKDWIANHLKGGCSTNVDRNACMDLYVEINLLFNGWILEGRLEKAQCYKIMLECLITWTYPTSTYPTTENERLNAPLNTCLKYLNFFMGRHRGDFPLTTQPSRHALEMSYPKIGQGQGHHAPILGGQGHHTLCPRGDKDTMPLSYPFLQSIVWIEWCGGPRRRSFHKPRTLCSLIRLEDSSSHVWGP